MPLNDPGSAAARIYRVNVAWPRGGNGIRNADNWRLNKKNTMNTHIDSNPREWGAVLASVSCALVAVSVHAATLYVATNSPADGPGTGAMMTLTDTNTVPPMRFYRVKVVLPGP